MSVPVVSRFDLQRKPLAWTEKVSPALELGSAIDTKRFPNALPAPSDRPDYFYKTLKVPRLWPWDNSNTQSFGITCRERFVRFGAFQASIGPTWTISEASMKDQHKTA
jgi:hypothetical protein